MIRAGLVLASMPFFLQGAEAPRLLGIRRIYVDTLTGKGAAQLRDMLIAALENSKEFAITENQEKADAILRGSAEDEVFTDTFQSSDSVHMNGAVSTGSNTSTSTARKSSKYSSFGVGETESTRIAERKHEASASVRLVARDGDVVWSTTQESKGAKFKGASADVADKIAKKLLSDLVRAREAASK